MILRKLEDNFMIKLFFAFNIVYFQINTFWEILLLFYYSLIKEIYNLKMTNSSIFITVYSTIVYLCFLWKFQ